MRTSIWEQESGRRERKPLSGGCRADVAVVGGGLTGVLTAYFLQEAGLHTVVIEADTIGGGQTGRTTAKITAQHGLCYHSLTERLGEETAKRYAEANLWAVDAYEQLITQKKIRCDFVRCSAYLYSTVGGKTLEQEEQAARRAGVSATLTEETELPFPVFSALRLDRQARFQPLRFLHGLAKELTIYEGTKVLGVHGNCLDTTGGEITADRIVFAAHYPFVNFPAEFFLRMHQERSYVLALEGAGKMEGMYLGVDPDGHSFRPVGSRLLLGGGGHRTGEHPQESIYAALRRTAQRYWPGCRVIAAWSAQDCMTLDGIPYIGPFSSVTPNWYVATGFQKWGMSTAMVAAKLLRDLIVQGDSPLLPVFSPERFHPAASARNLMNETAHAVRGLGRRLLTLPDVKAEEMPPGHGGIVEWKGKKVGVYKDETGRVFAVSIQCPHMGCQLSWNQDEKSWDCPCHGSRFDYRGKLLDGPAQTDLPMLSDEQGPDGSG